MENDIYQVTVIGNLNGQVVNNVLHAKERVAEQAGIAAEYCARGFFTTISAYWVNCCAESYQMAGIYVRRIKPTPGVPYLHIPASGHVGLVVGEAASTTGAGVISLYTNTYSKSGRGRIYMPGVAEASQANGVLTSDIIGDYQDLADQLTDGWLGHDGTAVTTGKYFLEVYSRVLGTSAEIVAEVVQPNMGTIRGRRAPRMAI